VGQQLLLHPTGWAVGCSCGYAVATLWLPEEVALVVATAEEAALVAATAAWPCSCAAADGRQLRSGSGQRPAWTWCWLGGGCVVGDSEGCCCCGRPAQGRATPARLL